MRRNLLFHRMPTRTLSLIKLGFSGLLLWISCLSSLGHAQTPPITPSGLNTQVSSIEVAGKTQFDITGGTRAGTNLFHSFGQFNVPNNNIANFLNEPSNPATSNILGRVTDGNISNIYGTIQTTGFGTANLFLMNPAGFLFGPNATVHVGGMVAFTSADYLRLADGVLFNATSNAATDALLSAAPVAAFGFLGSNPAAIAVQGSKLAVQPGQSVSLVGGNDGFTYTNPDTGSTASVPNGVTVTGGQLLAPGGQVNVASVASPGEILAGILEQAPNINSQSFGALGEIQISQKSLLDVRGNGGGTVLIRGGQFVLDNSTISANVTGPGPITNGVESIGGGIDIQVSQDAVIQNLAVIETNVVGNATPDVQYGSVHMEAEHIEIAGVLDFELFPFTGIRSDVHTGSTGGQSGNIELEANSILGKDLGQIETLTEGAGDAGNIKLTAIHEIDLNTVVIQSSSVDAAGNAGNIDFMSTSGNISMATFTLVTSQASISNGQAGTITLSAPSGNILLTDHASVFNQSFNAGPIGGIELTAKNLELNGESFISGDNLTALTPGNISLTLSDSLSLDGDSGITTVARGPAAAADLTIRAHDVSIADNSFLTTETFVSGPGGRLNIATENLQLISGGKLRSGSMIGMDEFGPTIPSGAGGTITILGLTGQAESIVIDGPDSGIFTDAQGTGAGGNIFANANSVTLQNGATVSASSTGQIENPGAAGSIDITATNGFTMQNSTITTQAGQGASGGNIKVTTSPEATVLLTNSLISASVADGRGGGGNISIDPQFVILQNSQILAQAAQGQGGTITITANLFLPDANSIVNADSGSGLHGTVTIQSPNAPASGKIQPLGKTPLQATSLLNQPCAALAGGEFSSFTVAGRDSLPTEPSSWLASPLSTLNPGMGLGVKAEGVRSVARGEGLEGETALLSLRQIAPAGFLTQTFAVDWSAGCQS